MITTAHTTRASDGWSDGRSDDGVTNRPRVGVTGRVGAMGGDD
jgi:hypothetical protein